MVQVLPFVSEVITNSASFQRVDHPASSSGGDGGAPSSGGGGGGGRGWGIFRSSSSSSSRAAPPKPSHRLTILPRHDYQACSHGCGLCPANLCKVSGGR